MHVYCLYLQTTFCSHGQQLFYYKDNQKLSFSTLSSENIAALKSLLHYNKISSVYLCMTLIFFQSTISVSQPSRTSYGMVVEHPARKCARIHVAAFFSTWLCLLVFPFVIVAQLSYVVAVMSAILHRCTQVCSLSSSVLPITVAICIVEDLSD